jgi:hypothetical protein
MPRKFKRTSPDDGFVVLVDVGMENIPNDLIGTLSANLSRYSDSWSSHDIIIEPSDVLAFQLAYKRQSSSRSNLDPFFYPKTLFLDRFLMSNVELANQKRRQEKDMNAEIVNLTTQKETLTRYNVCIYSTLASFVSWRLPEQGYFGRFAIDAVLPRACSLFSRS